MGVRRVLVSFRHACVPVVALAVLSAAAPAAAQSPALEAPPPLTDARELRFESALRTMRAAGLPERVIELLRRRAEIETETDTYALGVPDLDGDGIGDVLEWTTSFAITISFGGQTDPLAAEEEAETVFKLRSGSDGKKIWRRHYDDFVFPWVTTVADGKRGVLAIGGLLSFFGSSEVRLDVQSLKGRNGKVFWTRNFSSRSVGDYFNHAAVDIPWSFGLGDLLEGKPGDLAVTLVTEVSTLFASTSTSRVVVVDGSDGSLTIHPRVDVGINWTPHADVVGDIDRDGLDDYVVTNQPGVDPGGPQEPVTVGGTAYARRGTDGAEIWTTSGLEFFDFAWVAGLPNVTGTAAPEVVILTPDDANWRNFAVYLLDGEVGAERWKKKGLGVFLPGDIAGERFPDLLMGDAWMSFKRHRGAFTATAIQGNGKRIYKRTTRWSFSGLPCPQGLCSGGWGWGFGGAGDVHGDGIKEHHYDLYAQQDPGPAEHYRAIADGRHGRNVLEIEQNVYPALDSLDGRGDDLFKTTTKGGIATIEVLDGLTATRRLRTVIQRSKGLLPGSADAWAEAHRIDRDSCADIIVNMWSREGSFYAVLDGGSAKVKWSFWNGAPSARPRFTSRTDLNPAC